MTQKDKLIKVIEQGYLPAKFLAELASRMLKQGQLKRSHKIDLLFEAIKELKASPKSNIH